MADAFGSCGTAELPVGKEAVNRLIKENKHIFSDSQCKVCSAVLISESQKLAHYQSRKHANKYRRYMEIHQGEDFGLPKKLKTENSDEEDRNKCCPVCNMALSSPVVAQSHYEGKTHMKNLKLRQQGGIPEGTLLQTKKPIVRKPTVAAKTEDPLDSTKFCTLCHATFNNPLMAEQHYKGKKHKKQETKSQLMTIYTSSVNSLPQAPPPTVKGPSPGSESDFFSVGKGYSCDTCSIVLNSIEQYQAHISGLKHKNQILSMTSSSVECQPPAGGTSFTGALSSSGLPPSLVGAVAMGCPPSLDNPLTEGLSASGSATYGGLQQPPYAPPHNNQPYIHEDLMGRNDYNYYSKDC